MVYMILTTAMYIVKTKLGECHKPGLAIATNRNQIMAAKLVIEGPAADNLRHSIAQRQLRLADLVADFDRLRSGYISRSQLERCVYICMLLTQ